VAGGLAALVAVLAKLKAVIFVVLKLTFVATAGTAFVSVGAYSLLFGLAVRGRLRRAPVRS
jgi:hypothetical protein